MFFDKIIQRIDDYSDKEKIALFNEIKRRAANENEPLPRFFKDIFMWMKRHEESAQKPISSPRAKITDFFFAADMILEELYQFMLNLMIDIEMKHAIGSNKVETKENPDVDDIFETYRPEGLKTSKYPTK